MGAVLAFELPAATEHELLRSSDGAVVGRVMRYRRDVTGLVRVSSQWANGPGALLRVTIEVENTTDWFPEAIDRDAMLRRALVAPCTTVVRGIPSEVALEPQEDPIPRVSAVNLDSENFANPPVSPASTWRAASPAQQ